MASCEQEVKNTGDDENAERLESSFEMKCTISGGVGEVCKERNRLPGFLPKANVISRAGWLVQPSSLLSQMCSRVVRLVSCAAADEAEQPVLIVRLPALNVSGSI